MPQHRPTFKLLDYDSGIGPNPERSLCAAILNRAILDYLSDTHIERHTRRSARVWLFVNTPKTRKWSLAYICDILELNLEEIRAAIRNPQKKEELCDRLR